MTDERAVQEVFARYVRATDRRDGAAQGALFTDDAVTEIFAKRLDGGYDRLGEPLIGGEGVRFAVENFMAPNPPGGSSHHVTADHLVEVDGDRAHVNAQVIRFDTRAARPATDGVPASPAVITPTESGYYDTDLRRVDGAWKIVHHRVLGDLPLAGD